MIEVLTKKLEEDGHVVEWDQDNLIIRNGTNILEINLLGSVTKYVWESGINDAIYILELANEIVELKREQVIGQSYAEYERDLGLSD